MNRLLLGFCLMALGACIKELPGYHWMFVPHPHRAWSQKLAPWMCTWHTSTGKASDAITAAIMREGHCDHDVDSFPVFMLSSAQARACLANRTLLFSGDSYTIQLFVGFADILAGVPNRTEIAGGPLRRRILNRANLQLQELGINVRFVCQAANEGSVTQKCGKKAG